jgi:Negative regulator of sigma F
MSDIGAPPELLQAIARDLRPVRPLPSPVRRALAFVPVGLVLLLGMPLLWGFRANLDAVGTPLAWGPSLALLLAGLAVLALALREAVPGRALPRGVLAATVGGAAALVLAVAALTNALVPTAVPPGADWQYAWECLAMAGGPGLLGVAAAAWLASRALPTRPAVAGALYGLGVGLMADAGARLFCWVSAPAHVLLAHGGAAVMLAAAGAAVATVIDRTRR